MRSDSGTSSLSALTDQCRFLYTWLYQILLSCAIGGVIGFLARRSLKYAEAQDWIEDESFLAYGLGLTFLVLGIVGSASRSKKSLR